MKVIFNYATRQFESMEPTLRERFALGSKDPAPKRKTDQEVAGALMDAFPQQSFLQYQNAVDEGFQGTFEEFLQLNSLDKSELDMQAIEGQTAGALPKIFQVGLEEITKKSTKTRPPTPTSITKTSKTAKEFKKLDEGEQAYADQLLENFNKIKNNPQYKSAVPKKYKNIKDIRELVSDEKAYKKFITDVRDIQYKNLTDEQGLGKYSTLPKTVQNRIKSLEVARAKSAARPDLNAINIAGDNFKIPNNIGVLPSMVENLELTYPLLKQLDKNPTVDNYYKTVTGNEKRGVNLLVNDIQAYFSGVDNRTRSLFESPLKLKFVKSLDLENKLSPETIKLLTEQKGQKASNIYRIKQGMSEKARETLLKDPVKINSIKRLNEIYKEDPDIYSDELVNLYYGDSYAKAKPSVQKQMLKDLRNDVVLYYKTVRGLRDKPVGVRLPSEDKINDILSSIEFQKGKGGFNIYGGHIRDIQNKIAQDIVKPGYDYNSRIVNLQKKNKGQNVDHTVGLGAVHEVAPAYAEAVQIIKPAINKEKGILLERPATSILNDFFSGNPNKARTIGGETYTNFDDKVAAFNNLSKDFAAKYGIDTAIFNFGVPGKGSSPKQTVKYFSEYSKGAQKNMMELWNNHGFTITINSRPMGSKFFDKSDLRIPKNMGGMIQPIDRTMMAVGGRVDFANGTPDPFIDQAIAALESPNVADQFIKQNSPSVGEMVFGKDGDRTLMQQFNTQFLDPRSYPYYAQKTLRGAANIPEFLFKGVPKAGYAFIKDLMTNAGITKGGVEEILEALDPSITRDILNGEYGDLLGLSDQAIQASEEKRTGPQRTTGGILQLAGELPGPATPFFLIGKAPKLLKQLRDLGVTATGVEKINKEIEAKVAQQGVNQTRRDIVLSIGAGAGVGFLKYLGLDFLSKAPKVAEKAAPKIVTQGGTPKYFFDFVNLIKSKGDDISEKAATIERQKVYDYNGYTLTEQLDTGKINIRKETEGGGSYSIGDGEYETIEGIMKVEEINYNPPETIINDKGKSVRVPDNYSEDIATPDRDGGLGDVEPGLDSIDEVLELLAKDGKKYSLDELIEMGVSPDLIGDDFLLRILKDPSELKITKIRSKFDKKLDAIRKERSNKAGGGIMKMAGDDSGPPPKSGPTPHGLPYVAKNVKPIKERK
jgi:uncharacterized protein YneF (UPF0154 family)